MDKFNEIQQIKRTFFSLRNGIISDTLRKNGSPFKIIFGLLLPQLDDIAKKIGYNERIGLTLWDNKSTRESMLLAPMLMNPAIFPVDKAIEWASEAPSSEVLDILTHKLIRHMPDSYEIAVKMAEAKNEKIRYAAMRLLWHHISDHTDVAESLAKSELERNTPLTRNLANQIIEEIEFMRE